ncbi:sigma-54-dependent transcriptional regulator [Sphingomonas astaxanthinifaciens]|uniref:Sigma-54-dependent Fis family transcriptional regulator n=1 Tax=Sphingomonas astaxanthinifaciens DSM 22298 TaxID=1123267 RepID=A0ABQ5Z8P6_9SPHN|nr:sigma-54 dependent transcriptional regulator [Sphingomonas astaxanthinifaciens]GLR47952.1 sigma-54-dependent Fis family transcriptional regulator [Sphingomonas astaxanthinifaciens DSM 22298]
MALEVLVVDDEADIRDLVAGVLEDEGYAVRSAANSTEALDAIESRRPSLVLLDVWLQGSRMDGLQLLEEIKRRDPTLPILMISGHGNLDTAVAAIREGAIDFIEKPFEASRLLHLVGRATETDRLRRENADLKLRIGTEDQLNGSSVAINTVRATLKRVAPTGSRVLITGPAGVGKEIAARTIHNWSTRAGGPFVTVAAARMDPGRVEEELFGSETDGVARPGFLEQAHGGTLFLDEIADMPLTTQGKILRVLTDQSFTRSGGQRPVKVDVRVLSATSKNLSDEITAGRFREDLYYRLNVVPVRIPPLRERREDIPELANHYLARFAAERRMPPPTLSDEALAALQAHDWPGNVRQLRNIIERTVIMAPSERLERIEVDLLPAEVLDTGGSGGLSSSTLSIMGSPLREARESFEREYLRVQIRRFSGNISRTASFIGMERSALHRKLKALGLGDKGQNDEEDRSSS